MKARLQMRTHSQVKEVLDLKQSLRRYTMNKAQPLCNKLTTLDGNERRDLTHSSE